MKGKTAFLRVRRCAHTYVQIRRRMHPVYTVHVFVSILSLVYFFPSSAVCQSVRPSVCISPSWQPAWSPPSFDAIYRNDSCLKILHPVLCVPGFIGCFLMGGFKLKRDINVIENGSWFNEKMRTISLISRQQVGGEINYLHEGCFKGA